MEFLAEASSDRFAFQLGPLQRGGPTSDHSSSHLAADDAVVILPEVERLIDIVVVTNASGSTGYVESKRFEIGMRCRERAFPFMPLL
jgi:hypothetical protein